MNTHGYYPTTYAIDNDPSRECDAWLLVTVHPAEISHAPTFGCHDSAFAIPAEVQFHSLIVAGQELDLQLHGALDEVSAEILRAWERDDLLLSEFPFLRSATPAPRFDWRAA